jgi:hypothetical protein
MHATLRVAHLALPIAFAALFHAPTARAEVDPATGIDFVTITAPGNPNWTGSSLYNNNRGRVDYEYRIGRFEVTTAQWAEFINAAMDRPSTDRIPHVGVPVRWGAQGTTPTNPGGRRFVVPAGREMFAAGGISWRTAAIYCNWLHNGKGTNRDAFLTGAYDVSTFTFFNGGSTFTDQLTRSSGARYWIPSLDEWMKAAHYDPNKPNSDGSVGGWWQYSTTSDARPAYGPPGQRVRTVFPLGPDPNGPLAMVNAGWDDFDFAGFDPYAIALGSYAVTSPWGLYDAAGATAEWTEAYFQVTGEMFPRDRLAEGNDWGFGLGNSDLVRSTGGSADPALQSETFGLRVATNVPSPGLGSLGVAVLAVSLCRRRRHDHDDVRSNRRVRRRAFDTRIG